MFTSMFFQISAVFYCVLIMCSYFSKKRINSTETQLFSKLIIVNFFGLIVDLISTYLAIMNYVGIILMFFSKLYLVYLVTWISLMTLYVVSISIGKETNLKKANNTLKIFFAISLICVIFLPLYNNTEVGNVYTYGPSADITYVISGIHVFIWVILMLKNIKRIKQKKNLPMLFYITIGLALTALQAACPSILVITAMETFVTSLMYFTIENPDLKMIEQLDIAKTNAEKANRAKSDFLSSMSHEIRTPLNAIVGFSECILQENNIDDIKRDAKDVIMASQNLLEIVNGILDISKIEANKMEIVETEYELLPAIENIAKLMIPRIGEKPIELNTNFAVDIPYKMHGDIGKIKQIVTNILTNAVKYTDKGEINFNVNCVNEDNICSLVISVEDTGRGIKSDKLDKLFTKFDRLDEDKNTTIEGTGLGLAITKNLVDMLGGKIVVQSVYGKGSKFTIYLKQNIVQLHALATEIKIEEKLPNFKGMKVLIVDDNKLNLRVADKLLKRYEIDTKLIESGMECINEIKQNREYDLILLDDMMPRMSGTETLNRLKNLDDFDIPVVALTANAISGEREKYLDLGFDDYLAKPIDKVELEKILSKFLQKNTLDKKTNVLIVDDNKINIKVAENFLKPYNFEIDSVLSGIECIEKVKNKKYDLIFMDDMMPNLSGVETFKKLKEDESFDTPVIALTANAVSGARDNYLSIGFNEYISKPINKTELDKVIKKMLNMKPKKNINNTQGNIEYLKDNGIDIDKALSLLGDIEMYNETLNDFKNGLNERIIKLKRFKDLKDMSNYAILVHSLKSDCKYLGFTKLAEMAYDHELKSKANNLEYISENFDSLAKECMKLRIIIDKY